MVITTADGKEIIDVNQIDCGDPNCPSSDA
jgi:hypothetical protein